ncbi:MAG: FAD-dependent oxidoreductase [Verrucomicrobiota bacterium]
MVRDWNLRAAYGAFAALKRGEKAADNANASLKWISHVGGPRESRLLEGDVVLTQEDIVERRDFADGFIPTTWDIDLHYPRELRIPPQFPRGAGISLASFRPSPRRRFHWNRCLLEQSDPEPRQRAGIGGQLK